MPRGVGVQVPPSALKKMINIKKPYLIIPKLIHQPTWGGKYIVETKNLNYLPFLSQYSIGQSYELFSDTKLLTNITDSIDKRFCPEIGFADKPDIVEEYFNLENDDFINISDIILGNEEMVLGKKVVEKYHKMPLLIKVTQAKGNSYQLHVKENANDSRWRPKPESWYYFEPGLLTCGIRSGISVKEYEVTCRLVDNEMHRISNEIKNGKISVEEGRLIAKEFIQKNNPARFVNLVEAQKYDIYDMSVGGLHHSWEEDGVKFPQGNIVYEVQQDQMDPVSTVRCFDQGKIKDDGSIREINIDDYFKYLDITSETNDLNRIRKRPEGVTALSTEYYAMDVIKVEGQKKLEKAESFIHLYVREGDVTVETQEGSVHLTTGYSCFVSQIASDVTIKADKPNSVVLKTYIP